MVVRSVSLQLREAVSNRARYFLSLPPPPSIRFPCFSLSLSLLMHDLPLCGMWKGSRCYGNLKPDRSEVGEGGVGLHTSTRGDLMHCPHTHTNTHTHANTTMQRVIKIIKETLCRDLLIRLWRAELEISGAETH